MRKLAIALCLVFALPATAQYPQPGGQVFEIDPVFAGVDKCRQFFHQKMLGTEGAAMMAADGAHLHDEQNKLYILEQQYANAPTTPEMAHAIIADALFETEKGRAAAKGAVQSCETANVSSVRLQALQCAQNERMIQLLEQLAKK